MPSSLAETTALGFALDFAWVLDFLVFLGDFFWLDLEDRLLDFDLFWDFDLEVERDLDLDCLFTGFFD
jgi:hypothetical protein